MCDNKGILSGLRFRFIAVQGGESHEAQRCTVPADFPAVRGAGHDDKRSVFYLWDQPVNDQQYHLRPEQFHQRVHDSENLRRP